MGILDQHLEIDVKIQLIDNKISQTEKVLNTGRIVIQPDKPMNKENRLSLDALHDVYVANNDSGEATSEYLVNYLKENKDNPEGINNTIIC